MKNRKFSALIIIIILLVVIILLGGSLSEIVLLPGQPLIFGLNWNKTLETNLGNLPGAELLLNFIEIILLCGIIFFPVTILYLILSPKARKQFIREVIRVVPIVLLFIFIAKVISQQPITNKQFLPAAAPDSTIGQILPTQTVSNITTPPHWIGLIITLSLAVIVTGFILWGIWTFWNHRHKLKPLEQIANHALHAINELQNGGDITNIVINCYYEMSQVVNQQRGIRRESTMTTHEFENKLIDIGFPEPSIHQITQLFEEVRYGTLRPGVIEEHLAIASLNEIIKYCHDPV
jgi:hypothetical protein